MTGAVLASVPARLPAAVGAATPAAVMWTDIYDTDSGSTNTQSLTGFTTPITLSAAKTGSGLIYYTLNGAYAFYGGGFQAYPGDALSWTVSTAGLRTGNVSGVLTVTNISGAPTTLGTIAYTVIDGRGE